MIISVNRVQTMIYVHILLIYPNFQILIKVINIYFIGVHLHLLCCMFFSHCARTQNYFIGRQVLICVTPAQIIIFKSVRHPASKTKRGCLT